MNMDDLIKKFLSTELYLTVPNNSNIIFIDDFSIKHIMNIFEIEKEYLIDLIHEVMLGNNYEFFILNMDTLSSDAEKFRKLPNNYFILLDFLNCLIQMKIHYTNADSFKAEYLGYLERVIADELVLKLKNP